MTYILCEFDYGYTGQFYQEIYNGELVRNCDLDGNKLDLQGAYGARVVDPNPEHPVWAQ